jgi:hypothetical protein
MRAEGGTLPSGYAGGGVEVGWFSTYGRVLSYDRTASADKYLYLRGSAVMIQEGGNTILTVDGGDVYTVPFTKTTTPTVGGFSAFTQKNLFYKVVGDMVFVTVYIAGTSNSTAKTITLPYVCKNSTNYINHVPIRVANMRRLPLGPQVGVASSLVSGSTREHNRRNTIKEIKQK